MWGLACLVVLCAGTAVVMTRRLRAYLVAQAAAPVTRLTPGTLVYAKVEYPDGFQWEDCWYQGPVGGQLLVLTRNQELKKVDEAKISPKGGTHV